MAYISNLIIWSFSFRFNSPDRAIQIVEFSFDNASIVSATVVDKIAGVENDHDNTIIVSNHFKNIIRYISGMIMHSPIQ